MAILGPIWEKTKYRQALSGTPITDCVVDLYSLANKFLPSKFKNYYEFANTFAHQDVGPWATVYYGIKNAEVLKKIIRSTFFVRYTKEEAGLDLPPKVFQKVLLPDTYAFKVPVTEEEVLKAEVEALTLSIETGTKIPAVPKTIAGHRKAAAIKKLPAVIDFIENALEQEPVVVFGWHLDVIKNIASHFSAYNPSVITGETPPKDRQESVRRFQDGETKLFIGNMVAAGVGTTLTAASCVIMAELSWSPPDVAQSIDRLNRIGAKYTTSIYYFEVQGSIENRIIDAVVNKVKVFEKLMERSNA
jgi:SWI/SNF-related matrix-associated actin-dependent regulator 1 of chromatin subfamily A